jgi:hypothetical protein
MRVLHFYMMLILMYLLFVQILWNNKRFQSWESLGIALRGTRSMWCEYCKTHNNIKVGLPLTQNWKNLIILAWGSPISLVEMIPTHFTYNLLWRLEYIQSIHLKYSHMGGCKYFIYAITKAFPYTQWQFNLLFWSFLIYSIRSKWWCKQEKNASLTLS